MVTHRTAAEAEGGVCVCVCP